MNPKRRFLQIHLSTAIVLMLVAAGLLWLNLMPARTYSTPPPWQEGQVYYAFKTHGWPCAVLVETQETQHKSGKAVVLWEGVDAFNRRELAIDIAAALGGLALIGFGCEWLIRRRGTRKVNA